MATPTFEEKNILNRKFYGNKFVNQNLVELDGIYYHFEFDFPQAIHQKNQYQVIKNNGNQLTIKKL